MREYQIRDLSELEPVVKDVLAILKEREGEREDGPPAASPAQAGLPAAAGAAVLALHGELGAGKTAFMQTLARLLGVRETVTSPTFVVMKKYDTQDDVFTQFVHIDAHRIEAVDEMRPLRFREELIAKGHIIGIEWAEKLEGLLPPHTLHVYLALEGDVRTISINDDKQER